jgi:hypothetical protein
MNKVVVTLKNNSSWIVNLNQNGLEHKSPNELKNMFLNKTITDGDETVLITGIKFQNNESNNLIELFHESKSTDAFLNL